MPSADDSGRGRPWRKQRAEAVVAAHVSSQIQGNADVVGGDVVRCHMRRGRSGDVTMVSWSYHLLPTCPQLDRSWLRVDETGDLYISGDLYDSGRVAVAGKSSHEINTRYCKQHRCLSKQQQITARLCTTALLPLDDRFDMCMDYGKATSTFDKAMPTSSSISLKEM